MVRALGWGMTWSDFEMATDLDAEAHEIADALDRRLSAATDADLTVPMEVYDAIFYAPSGARRFPIGEIRLLARTDTNGGRREASVGPASDLFELVRDGDDPSHVVFFPSLAYRRAWHRRSDDIDLAFESHRSGPAGDDGMRRIVEFTKFGHYPFANSLMDPASGAPLEWQAFWRLDEAYPSGWAPDVPSEIRWYLPKLGILDTKRVEMLRPMLAQWWT
jgi:hypothetical protein